MNGKNFGAESVKRSTILMIIIVALFAMLLGRILTLQTCQFDKYQAKVIDQMTTETSLAADRGNIYSSNGTLLATNKTAYRVFISPRAIASVEKSSSAAAFKYRIRYGMSKADTELGMNQAEKVARGLAYILGTDYEEILKQTTYTRYLDRTIARDVSEETADRIRNFIAANDLYDQVFLEATSKRYYVYDSLASSTIGFVSTDGKGQYGLELQYDEYLKGIDGKYITARDSNGNELPNEYREKIDPVDGSDITTTIDVFIQSVLEENLAIAVEESSATNRACGIVIDVNTGAILAMADYPGYDLNNPRELSDYYLPQLNALGLDPNSKEYSDEYKKLLFDMWTNKSVTESYIPGSTFKIVTSAMALAERVQTPDHSHYCRGSLTFFGHSIHCYKLEGHNSISFAEGLQQSCNVVFMETGQLLGKERYKRYFEAFGYTQKTGIDLPGEGGSVFNLETDLDLVIYAFGQNFTVTPIQQICAISAVANGGNLVSPYLVEKVSDKNGNILYSHGIDVKRQVINSEVCETVSKILEEGVSGTGGAKNAYVAGYRVAGKTGTSEKKGFGDEGKYICSTVAYAPADDPKVAVLIIVDEPTEGVLYGSVVAAPYVGNVLEKALPYLGVEAVYSDEELAKLEKKVPSYVSWTAATAKTYAEASGFEVKIVGDGNIVNKQVPEAGSIVEKASATIILYTGSARPQETITVPNLVGRTAADANSILIQSGLNIKIEGTKNYLSGKGPTVVSQSHMPGTTVSEGTVITVKFLYLDEDEDALIPVG